MLELTLEWAPAPRAVVLAGSHAGGEAVWIEHRGGLVSLSDIDLYVLLDDDGECRAARARSCDSLKVLARRCLAFGLAAPLEVGFHTPSGIQRLPARPGTIELSRHGRVIHGDARALDLVPRFREGDVSAEEILLLLENRGCELLWCRPLLSADAPLDRLKGRHATLKCALDLAAAACLLGGEYPDGARSRIGRARERRPEATRPQEWAEAEELDRLWEAALSWRGGEVAALAPANAEEEWGATVRGWTRVWREASGRLAPGAPGEPVARALAMAGRARLRRRVRDALLPRARVPASRRRIWSALGGTVQHRVHASATLLLLAAGAGLPRPLPPRAAEALARLGVVPRAACGEWDAASPAVVEAWDRWLLDGQRTAPPA